MYTVLFHRYDRLGCNLINYIAQIIYAHHHGYYIKFLDNKDNYPKYPNSKYYIICLWGQYCIILLMRILKNMSNLHSLLIIHIWEYN